jgi:hypothetical protein
MSVVVFPIFLAGRNLLVTIIVLVFSRRLTAKNWGKSGRESE